MKSRKITRDEAAGIAKAFAEKQYGKCELAKRGYWYPSEGLWAFEVLLDGHIPAYDDTVIAVNDEGGA